MHAERLQVVLADHGFGNRALGHDRDLGAVGGVHGEGDLAVDRDPLDIGEMLQWDSRGQIST